MAYIWVDLLGGFKEIFSAPFKDPSIWWILAPIILFWLILEVYFGKYKTEKLGWNSALLNGLTLFWIVIISIQALFANNFELFTWSKLLFVIFAALYSVFIIFICFTRGIGGNVAFLFASPTIIHYLCGLSILWTHGLIAMSLWVAIDLILLYILVLILETILKKLIPSAPESGLENIGTEPRIDAGFGNTGRGLGRF